MNIRVVIAGAAICLSLFAAACGDGEATVAETVDMPTVEAAADDNETTAPTPTPEASDDDELEEGESPIENLLGVPIFDDAAMDEWFEDLSREAEIVVATCMRAEGFEYSPTAIGGTGDTTEAPRDSLEYAEQRGLGIVTSFNEAEYNPATAPPDRNAEYIASLSDGERDAYQMALTGDVEPDGDPFAQGGCRGVATEEVFEIVAVFDAIGPVFDSYYDLYISDSRIIATTAQWQACMSEAGFSFADEDAIFDYVFSGIDEVMSDDANFADFDADEFPDTSGPAGSLLRPPLVPAAQATIDELGEEEKAIAVANWECREPINDIEMVVQREYEAEFVAEVGPQVQELQE